MPRFLTLIVVDGDVDSLSSMSSTPLSMSVSGRLSNVVALKNS